MPSNRKYVLLDANIPAAYYLPLSTRSKKTIERAEVLFDSARSGASEFFFYLPNFCIAEVFSVFMKYSFGAWNSHVRSKPLDTRVYKSLVKQFEDDIHNGKFIYHYELSRYHVLAINLVAPVDHYFQISRASRKPGGGLKKPSVRPAGTFDHLVIAMGVHLAKIHGSQNVVVVSSDSRLTDVLAKCKSGIPATTVKKLKLDRCEELTGVAFAPESFPGHVNLKDATVGEIRSVFGEWPLPVGKMPKVYRYNP